MLRTFAVQLRILACLELAVTSKIDEEIVILHAHIACIGAEHVYTVHLAHVDQKRYLDMRQKTSGVPNALPFGMCLDQFCSNHSASS